ncbi:hypothetical protein F5B20DRAFT_558115 [Whalleya microplaca]|nr:hypothetical protein F5B20DRAFT_558115 [Whalleya microplaca]
MEITNTSDPLRELGAATQTAIADLNPNLSDSTSRAVRGVVTITWPYNSVKNAFSFILAEPDFRRRLNKGQVRIGFNGSSAKVVGDSGLSSGDEVLVGLDGVVWEPEQTKKRQSLPGSGIDWKLKFEEKLLLQVTLGETGETRLIAIDHPLPVEPSKSVEAPSTEITRAEDASPPSLPPSLPASTPLRNVGVARLNDGEYASPAFIKRARVSYGSLFEDGYDIFEEDGGVRGGSRKRMRFGRESGAWRYSSLSRSPEPAVPVHGDVVGQDEEHASSPPRQGMTDEGCQTMELDVPVSSPLQTNVNIEEARKSPNLPPVEEPVDHPQGAMVDQGVQGYPQSEWPNSIPASHPPFGSTGMLPSSGFDLPAFPSGLNGAGDNPQQGWDHRHADFAPESHPKDTLALPYSAGPPLSNGFANTYESQHPLELEGARLRSRSRSLSEPNNLAVEDAEHNGDIHHGDIHHGLPVNDQYYTLHAPEPSMAYPPLDPPDEEKIQSTLPETLHDYPQSYLHENQGYSHDILDAGKNPFSQGAPTIENRRFSSWATINNNPQVTPMPQTDRLGSADGHTPDAAVVIDESDDEDPAPTPTAVEDTVMDRRADALETYEDAEAEDEVDAENSDDDEPEYDADEIGGDYDTRNYVGPDDDEDDSHDEDLRPNDVEPEFDEAESWDEEDEDEENAEYDSEDETDNSDAENVPPKPPSQPQVIDLISSSEDEGEEEEEETTMAQLLSRTVPSSSSQNVPSQSLGPGSQSDNEEYEEGYEEEYEEDIDEQQDQEFEEESEESEAERSNHEVMRSSSLISPNGIQDIKALDKEEEEAEELPEDHDMGEVRHDIDPQPQSSEPEKPYPNGFSKDQEDPPRPGPIESIAIKDGGEDNDMQDVEEEAELVVPQSAADGLEILRRAIENETNPKDQLGTSDDMPEEMIIEKSLVERKKPPTAHIEAVQVEDDLRETEENGPIDTVPAIPNAVSKPQPLVLSADQNVEVNAPSSPPLTLSFKSQATEERMETLLEENTIITQGLANQLPTPFDSFLSQVVDASANLDSAAAISMEVDKDEVQHPSEPRDALAEEDAVAVKPSMDILKPTGIIEDATESIEIDAAETTSAEQGPSLDEKHAEATDSTEAGLVGTIETAAEQFHVIEQARESSVSARLAISPSLTVESQITGEITQADVLESTPKAETSDEAQVLQEADADVSGIGLSFVSQMEGDEELQASILEDSPDLEEELDPEVLDALSENESHSRFEDDTDEVIQSYIRDRDDALEETLEIRKQLLETQEAAETSASPQSNIIDEEVDAPESQPHTDSSVQLARAANASRRARRQRDAESNGVHPHAQPVDLHSSPTSEEEDSSVQLARASLKKSPQIEPDNPSMTAAKLKLSRHLRDELPDCTPLKLLRLHLRRKLDVMAVATMQPPAPRRAKGGPREYMLSFTVSDHTVGPHAVAEVQFYRPHIDFLPRVKTGDVVLLRRFTVVALPRKGFGLRTNDESSWAVFEAPQHHPDHKGEDGDGSGDGSGDEGEGEGVRPAQIRGPPIEYGSKETTYVADLRTWFGLLDDEKARALLARANRKIVDAGKSK